LVIDPLQGESAAEIPGKEPRSFGSKSEIIPEEFLGPLVRGVASVSGAFCRLSAGRVRRVEAIRSRMGPDHFLYVGTRCLRRLSPAVYPLGVAQTGPPDHFAFELEHEPGLQCLRIGWSPSVQSADSVWNQ
jgi:hypothetical protein